MNRHIFLKMMEEPEPKRPRLMEVKTDKTCRVLLERCPLAEKLRATEKHTIKKEDAYTSSVDTERLNNLFNSIVMTKDSSPFLTEAAIISFVLGGGNPSHLARLSRSDVKWADGGGRLYF